jgi:uncharacterized membrane protein (UPF0127 family)
MPRRLSRLPVVMLDGGLAVAIACGRRARLCGLAGLRSPLAGAALLLAPCRSVHTAGMRWSLDLVWLGPGGGVVRLDRDVEPWRVRSCRRARAVIEVPAGRGEWLARELRHEEGPRPSRRRRPSQRCVG